MKRYICGFVLCAMVVWAVPASANSNAIRLYALTQSMKLDDNSILKFGYYDRSRSHSSSGEFCTNLGPKRNYYSHFGQLAMVCNPFGYSDTWFSFIDKHPSLVATVDLLLEQLGDVATRLDTAHSRRSQLLEKFGKYKSDQSFLEPIDADILYLSKTGAELQMVSKRFFDAIKPKLIDAQIEIEVSGARKAILGGLTSFEQEMDRVTTMPDDAVEKSLEEIIAAVDRAVRQLEEAKAQ